MLSRPGMASPPRRARDFHKRLQWDAAITCEKGLLVRSRDVAPLWTDNDLQKSAGDLAALRGYLRRTDLTLRVRAAARILRVAR